MDRRSALTNPAWSAQQAFMEDWYRDIIRDDPESADKELLHDYAPIAPYLSRLRGKVIDVGGGAGPSARFLDPHCQLTVVDPAEVWTEPQWQDFTRRFCGERDIRFVVGSGEDLPFADDSFDAGLALWSLNHAEDAERCIGELARVVRPGGKVLLLLEDMEPSWPDLGVAACESLAKRLHIIDSEHPTRWYMSWIHHFLPSLRCKLLGRRWPTQPDHFPISEAELRRWLAPRLRVEKRVWRGGYLNYEVMKVS